MQKNKTNSSKQVFIWIGAFIVIVAVVVGLVFIADNSPSSVQSTQNITELTPVSKNDIAIGNQKSKVVLIEYADFQCPACGAYYPIVKQVLNDYKNKILYIYRFFPLTNLHQNAMISAQAAYAAYKQGEFEPMFDMLFSNQSAWAGSNKPMPVFLSYAAKLGFNKEQFQKDIIAQSTINFINNEFNTGLNIGINHTPTFFLDGKEIAPNSLSQFETLINNELSKN